MTHETRSLASDERRATTMSPLRRKPVSAILSDSNIDSHGNATMDSGDGLKRSIGTFPLTMIGVGATIGTGIFFVLGQAVPEAGPAVVISFIIAATVAGLTALCYAELASMIPVAGSSYSYSYATLGEIVGFGVAACLLLEYGVSSAAVAVGWSEYVNLFLNKVFGFELPSYLMRSFIEDPQSGGINAPAVILVFLCMALLLRGAKESAVANAVMVSIKLLVLLVFIIIAFSAFKLSNFTDDFFAVGTGTGGHVKAISVAAASIFFSYVGLDAVSTAGEEVTNPRKTLPRAIIFALLIVTAIYVLVATAGIGAQNWKDFSGQEAGLSQILINITGANFWGTFVAAGAIISIFSVTLVTLYGQTRILYTISRDGLLPKQFRSLSSKTRVPVFNTVIVSIIVATMAAIVPLSGLWNLVSLGTLIAFSVVAIGVMILRRTEPEAPRGFKVPLYPALPIIAIAASFYLIKDLGSNTLLAGATMLLGAMMFYGIYSYQHSTYQPFLGDHNHRPRMMIPGAILTILGSVLYAIMFWLIPDTGWHWLAMSPPDSKSSWIPLALFLGATLATIALTMTLTTRHSSDGRSLKPARSAWIFAYTGVFISLLSLAYFVIMNITANG
ncbi:MAG: APC family permease [Propionibacteriaceae bacterium]